MAETSQMVRSYLKNLGYKDEDVTYQAGASGQPGTVNLQGKYFTQGTPGASGYISMGQSGLDSALNQFKTNQASGQANELLDTYKANIMQPVQSFAYDVNQIKNNPTYQSQLNSFTQDTNRGTNQALVNLGRRGIGNSQSGVVAETAGQQNINNFANNDLLPRMIAEAYSKYVDKNNQQNTQNQNILGLAGVYNEQNQQLNDQNQQNWLNRFNFGQATGTFNDGKKTTEQAQIDYNKARDSIADERYKAEFDEDNRRYGLEFALKKAESNNMMANRNAGTSQSASNESFNRLMDLWKSTSKAPAGLEKYGIKQGDAAYEKGTSATNVDIGSVMDELSSLYTAKNSITGAVTVSDPIKLKNAIIARNYSDEVTDSLLIQFGLEPN